jgi:hypothetical protein
MIETKKRTRINHKKVKTIISEFDNWIFKNTTFTVYPIFKELARAFIPYDRWYVGITKFQNGERLKQHMNSKNVKGLCYFQIQADTVVQANMVEKHFSSIGTSNAPEKRGAKEESTMAYVFKTRPNLLDEIFGILES